MKKLTLLILIAGVVFFARQQDRQQAVVPFEDSQPSNQDPGAMNVEVDTTRFHCDGRTRCREMRSCEEAHYFLAHCPGPKMDGDGDGIPCEDQLCGH